MNLMNMGSMWSGCWGQLPEGLTSRRMCVDLVLQTEGRQGRGLELWVPSLAALQILWRNS